MAGANTQDYIVMLRARNNDLRQKLAQSRSQMRGFTNFANNFARDIASSFGIGFSVYHIVAFGKAQLDLIRRTDQLNKSLAAVTQTSEKFNEAKKFLRATAKSYGLEIESLTASYNKFIASSKGTSLEGEQAEIIFRKVSKAASVMGLSVDETDGVLKALGQIMSKGKVQAEELRGQLGDRLPGAFNIMAKSMGVTNAQLDKMLKSGGVIADEVLPNFATELEKAYGADKVSKIDTITAAQNRFTNAWKETIEALDDGNGVISKAYKGILGTGTQFVENLKDQDKLLKMYLATVTGGVPALMEYLRITKNINDAQQDRKTQQEELVKAEALRMFNVEVAEGAKTSLDFFKIWGNNIHWKNAEEKALFISEIFRLFAEKAKKAMDEAGKGTSKFVLNLEYLESKLKGLEEQQKQASFSAIGGINDQIKKLEKLIEKFKNATNAVRDYTETVNALRGFGAKSKEFEKAFEAIDPSVFSKKKIGMADGDNVILERYKKNTEAYKAAVKERFDALNSIAETGLENAIAAFAEGLGSGGLDKAFEGLFDVIGTGLQSLGKALIAFGFSMQAFKKAFTNPFVAIAAGAAAIAAGALVKKSAANLSGSVGGSGYSSGGGGGDFSNKFGQKSIRLSVEGRLSMNNRELFAEFENYLNRNSRVVNFG